MLRRGFYCSVFVFAICLSGAGIHADDDDAEKSEAQESVELTDTLRAIPIVEPEVFHTVGLVVSDRYPVQPAVTSLIEEARARAPQGLLPAA